MGRLTTAETPPNSRAASAPRNLNLSHFTINFNENEETMSPPAVTLEGLSLESYALCLWTSFRQQTGSTAEAQSLPTCPQSQGHCVMGTNPFSKDSRTQGCFRRLKLMSLHTCSLGIWFLLTEKSSSCHLKTSFTLSYQNKGCCHLALGL